jgi:hypothetical protein
MRAIDKMELINKIGRELQSRFTADDLVAFLNVAGLRPSPYSGGSKRVYAKNVLLGESLDTINKIADELEIRNPSGAPVGPPRNWGDTPAFRLFISHISTHKGKATRLKDCLTRWGISGFVAHEDIHPTLDWQHEIEKALATMDAFLSMHTPGFSQSIWTQQEIGYAVGRGIKIIPFKMGEDPTGFISKWQALPRRDRSAEQIASEVETILSEDARTAPKLKAAQDALGIVPF